MGGGSKIDSGLETVGGAYPPSLHLLHTSKLEVLNRQSSEYFVLLTFRFLSSPLFADGQFPIEISSVTRDHDFLDGDAIEALCR